MQIKYTHKMIRDLSQKNNLPLTIFEESEISEEVLKILKTNISFAESGIFGNSDIGFPVEYEKLIIIEDGKEKVFEYYNKSIHYLSQNNENARQIFQAFTFFMVKVFKK